MSIVRRGRRIYCYRPVWRFARMTNEYWGSGAAALEAEEQIRAARRQMARDRAALRDEWQALRDQLEPVQRRVKQHGVLVDHVYRIALHSAGFHLHNRGWRMRGTAKAEAQLRETLASA